MKSLFSAALLCLLTFGLGCQSQTELVDDYATTSAAEPVSMQVVEASCGQCKFGMDGGGCSLAVRIDGRTYFVDGSALDAHGDAHAEDGMCNCVRKAKVAGELKDGRFIATSFEVLPQGE